MKNLFKSFAKYFLCPSLALAAVLFVAAPLFAQGSGHDHGAHSHDGHDHGGASSGGAPQAGSDPSLATSGSQGQGGLYSAVGIVAALRPDRLSVEIDHEPIAALNWPRMTMGFTARSADLLKDLKVGDQVIFDFRASGTGYLIVEQEKK
jgi:Cu/Ag efflux protein CusF